MVTGISEDGGTSSGPGCGGTTAAAACGDDVGVETQGRTQGRQGELMLWIQFESLVAWFQWRWGFPSCILHPQEVGRREPKEDSLGSKAREALQVRNGDVLTGGTGYWVN